MQLLDLQSVVAKVIAGASLSLAPVIVMLSVAALEIAAMTNRISVQVSV